jgi:HlyD family secretion protein
MTAGIDLHHSMPFKRSLRRNMLLAFGLMTILLVSGYWASLVEISGAVIATGKVAVSSEVKKVQHSTGGVVGEILVTNGQKVRAGDVVARLDATITRANLAIVAKSLDDMLAKRARLAAERNGMGEIDYPADLITRGSDPDVARVISSERAVFMLRREALEGQKARLREQIVQLKEQIDGLETQSDATNDQLRLANTDLAGVRKLWDQRLVQYSRLNNLEREVAKLRGEMGSLSGTIAQVKAKITETELEILQVDQDFRSGVARDMSDIDASIAEFSERKITAQDQLNRIDIRAPQDGVVHQLAVHTVGGVVAAQETLMLIVPQSDPLVVDARISPGDIDQAFPGQSVFVRFQAFNQKTTPEGAGTLERISPDLVTDSKTGAQYYEARIRLAGDEGLKLVPGMPVSVFLQTGDRSIFSYLIKPCTDFLAQAFRAT